MALRDELLGESAAIVAIREQIDRLLRSAGSSRRLPPLLILGETGTGKGLLAGALHRASARREGPFVDVNCAAIPETLLEAEMFGFERGAFTDARQAKPGLFQAANGGTIFLDEVALLPLPLQSKLLKVIEERSVRRLGSTRSEPLDVSVVAAASADLGEAVRAQRFRADLYHRLAVVTVLLPPLRARGRDVVTLAEHFLARICEDYGLSSRALTADAEAALLAHPWPGNVRELGNVLERAALLGDDQALTAARLGLAAPRAAASTSSPTAPARAASAGPASAAPLANDVVADAHEAEVLLDVLRASDWNLSRAAARLGVPRNTLRYRAQRLGLEPESPPARRRGGRPPSVTSGGETPAAPAAEVAWSPRRVTLLAARLFPAGAEGVAWGVGRVLESTGEKVRSFGGWVHSTDDLSLVAAFAHVPDEDAPRRAAHAAIAIRKLATRERINDPGRPAVAMALHTTSLKSAGDGETSRFDAADWGEASAVLTGLLDEAGPGTILASAGAARFLAPRFDLAPHEGDERALPGAVQLVRHAEPGRTRFVGREGEMRLLLERFELAARGRGQVVLIVGEPGIGKSRLLHELRHRLGSTATWVEGHALSFGRSIAFHPVIDMVRRVFRIDEADPPAVVGEKIERGVRRLGDDLDHTVPFARDLLSIDPGDPAVAAMDPRQRHAQIITVSHLLLERGAERRTHVVVLEDAHWADAATEDWLARLGDGVAAKRVMIIVTYRPGYRPPLGDQSFHTGLALSTLSTSETVHIARELLGAAELSPALQALITERAEGNPFFVEELTRSLQEMGAVRPGERPELSAGVDQVAIPETVEDVIRARMGRLQPALAELLQVASVIGRTVPVPLLAAVSGRAEEKLAGDLRRLQAAEFLYETRVFPELEHTFKHSLTQDVAYASLEPDRRRALHARIVDALERLYAGRLGERVERLAYHALLGEQWPRALRYYRQAGARAFDRSANREAVASWEGALTALDHLSEHLDEAIDIRLALRSALLQLGAIERIATYLREAETLALCAGDRPRLAWVWTYMTIAHLFAGEPARALATGERAFALAEEVGDSGLRATARMPWAHALRERGELLRAIALCRETIASLAGDRVRERLGQAMPPALYAKNVAAMCLADTGEFAEAMRLASESASAAQSLDLPFGLVLAHIASAHTSLMQGRAGDAEATLAAAMEIIEARDLPTWWPWAAATRGYALALAGRPCEGAPWLEQALARALALPFHLGRSQWVAWLAHTQHLAGRHDAAARLVDESLSLGRERGERGHEAWALYVLGEVEADGDGEALVAGESATGQALRLATELSMWPLAARCQLALARIRRRRGDDAGAHASLDAARALVARLDMPLLAAGAGSSEP